MKKPAAKKSLILLLEKTDDERRDTAEWGELVEKAKTLKFWFRQKYNLPPNDPRFLSATDSMILEDYLLSQAAEDKVSRAADEFSETASDPEKYREWQERNKIKLPDFLKPKPRRTSVSTAVKVMVK